MFRQNERRQKVGLFALKNALILLLGRGDLQINEIPVLWIIVPWVMFLVFAFLLFFFVKLYQWIFELTGISQSLGMFNHRFYNVVCCPRKNQSTLNYLFVRYITFLFFRLVGLFYCIFVAASLFLCNHFVYLGQSVVNTFQIVRIMICILFCKVCTLLYFIRISFKVFKGKGVLA